MAQGLRIVVHDQNARGLVSGAHRAGVGFDDLRPSAALLLGHWDREGEPRALADPGALSPDASSMRLHQPLADGEAQPCPPCPRLPLAGHEPRMLAEELRQQLR